MNIFFEKTVFTRREFFKGAGTLAVSLVIAGVFAKLGLTSFVRSDVYIAERAAGLYQLDASMPIRRSHENPEILALYQEFLSPGAVKPVSEKAHHLLHTRYGKDALELVKELQHSQVAA